MSGTPTEAEIQTQWSHAINILETMRNHIDATHAGGAGLWDTLEQTLEGEYLPAELSRFVNDFRAGCSDLISPSRAAAVLTPILFEYMKRIDLDATTTDGFGSGKRSVPEMFRALYDWFNDNTLTVESRAISYDTTATTSGTGNGAIERLTVDENGYNLEACHVETKRFKCVADRNSGVNEHAEIFEVIGEASSFDSVLRASFGSGTQANTTIVSKNAGNSQGGSLLSNSSFTTYDAAATPKFSGWTEDSGSANISQDAAVYYRSHPGATAGTDASLDFTGNAKISQPLSAMRTRRLDPDLPYQVRLMWRRENTADGTLTLRMGTSNVSVDVTTGTNDQWNELIIGAGSPTTSQWFRQFNEADLDIEIELASNTTGNVLVDDVIFAPYDLIDGTYWWMRQNAGGGTAPVSWLLDDKLVFTDTGGAPSTGKIQWWLWVAGLGYLPSSGTPTFADPT